MQKRKKFVTHRRINNLLTIISLLIGVYLIATPFLPAITFWAKEKTGQINTEVPYSADDTNKKPIPEENWLSIPKIGVDSKIVEGQYANVLSQGVWHRPNTSSPDKGGNTVFAAHRFTYSDPAIFYHLDQLKPGDTFSVFWNKKEYKYRVSESFVVDPSAIHIEDPSDDTMLTLYTCTPLWTAKQRLVVRSELIE